MEFGKSFVSMGGGVTPQSIQIPLRETHLLLLMGGQKYIFGSNRGKYCLQWNVLEGQGNRIAA